MMAGWRRFARTIFLLGFLGFLMSVVFSLVQGTVVYAPPDVMVRHTTLPTPTPTLQKAGDLLLSAVSLAILAIAGIAGLLREKTEEPGPGDERGS